MSLAGRRAVAAAGPGGAAVVSGFTSSLCGGNGGGTSLRNASAKMPVVRLPAKFHSRELTCGAYSRLLRKKRYLPSRSKTGSLALKRSAVTWCGAASPSPQM